MAKAKARPLRGQEQGQEQRFCPGRVVETENSCRGPHRWNPSGGHCHCSSLLDIHCAGLDRIPRFVASERVYAAIDMAEQFLSDVPQSAVDGLRVRSALRY